MSNNYILTATGNRFYFDNLEDNTVSLKDIAHHLSKIQRCGGAVPIDKYYSVAEHSILVAGEVLKRTGCMEAAKAALLHDATEAYLGDVVSPLKKLLPDYAAIEDQVQELINKKYNLSTKYNKLIKKVDKGILWAEMRQLEIPNVYDNIEAYQVDESLDITIDCLTCEEASNQFLRICYLLGISDEH